MDYLQTIVNSFRMSRENTKSRHFIPFSDIINDEGYNIHNVWLPKVERLVKLVRRTAADVHSVYEAIEYPMEDRHKMAERIRQDALDYVGDICLTRNNMIYLLRSLESEKYADVRRSIMNTLFGYPNTEFYSLIKSSAEPIPFLVEDPDGDLELYGIRFKVAKNLDFSSTEAN